MSSSVPGPADEHRGSVHQGQHVAGEGQQGLPNTIKPLQVVGTLEIKERKEAGIVYAIYGLREARATIMDY